jgi:hypothetical protein
MPQLGGPCPRLEPLLLSPGHLVLDQDTEPLEVIEGFGFGIVREVTQVLGHAFQAEFA